MEEFPTFSFLTGTNSVIRSCIRYLNILLQGTTVLTWVYVDDKVSLVSCTLNVHNVLQWFYLADLLHPPCNYLTVWYQLFLGYMVINLLLCNLIKIANFEL